MNQNTQEGNSNEPNMYLMKRKRGRPRKDPNLKRVEVARYGMRENKSHQAETIDFSNNDGMLGQPINGVIEATFDAGYLLNVKIGNSSSNYRGLVFKPGNFAPITASNDVAPHAQMIKRNNIPFPLQRERFEINGALVPAFNGSSPSDSSDKDVVAAEPLSVLLPFGSQSSNQFMAAKTDKLPLRRVVPPGSFQNANDSSAMYSQMGMSQGTKNISFSQGTQHM